ncbi:MAG: Holliday junction resolvase RuvX [Armatimonadetes bacterium]|nr:Holliday junction resolvase RuvX [Armatimonadota bacterium]
MSVHLALDVGSETIGLAVGDPQQDQVRALYTLTRISRKRDLAAVAEEYRRQRAEVLVVGLARYKSGDEGESASRARRIGDLLAAMLECPIIYQDELHSTTEARSRLAAQGVSPRMLTERLDAEAARVILEMYFKRLHEP